ncbi:uncharacterized protein LOC111066636 [Drosophila obscura]|uniref:uncharacterized protein LOC111066636 n=1 Tax=Drosophila obscura TaxID=7282 RepID=UPI001BB2A0A3|nr:uncharacterized protein LOC111066636 [Drosophila obscura]
MEPTQQTYNFDAILVKSKVCEPDTINDYTYSIRLFKNFEELPEDRMLVEDFSMDPLGQFVASPCELIGILTSKGVCVTVSKSGDLLGAGSALLTPLLLRQLTDPTFLVTETIKLDLAKGGRVVESVEIIIKFSSLHPELDPGLVPLGCYDICRPVDKSINYRDVIFTLGRSNKCPGTSCITDQRLMSHTGAPFQCVHNDKSRDAGECGCSVAGGEIQPDPEVHREQERGMLKKLFKELGLDKIRIPAPPDNYEESRRWHCRLQPESTDTNSSDCLYDTWLEEKKQNSDSGRLCLSSSQQEQIRRKVLGSCRTNEPELKQETYKRPNLCALCQSDISWLPKIAGCPYCGYRNIETMESCEQPYDFSATAQQLIRDCLRKEACIVSSSEEDRKAGAHLPDPDPNIPDACGCMSGRVCTRCRIRKLCEQFFTEQENKSQNAGGLRDEGGHQKKGQSPKKIPSSTSHHRSKLITIFSEIRNIYDKKKGEKDRQKNAQDDPKTAALRDECEAACNSSKSARDRLRARRSMGKPLKGIDKDSKRKSKRKRCQARLHRSKSKRYSYLDIPKKKVCLRIGHKRCISDSKYTGYCKVPCHMGWMWTKSDMARFKAWRPGAISRPIRQLMAYFLKDFPADTICLSRYHYRNRGPDPEDALQETLVQHPTLHILKKRDEYIITLRPLKDPQSLALCANPYADMKPVVFRITKDPIAADLREMKMSLKRKGFPPCQCDMPVASCYCRSHIDKKRLEYEVESMLRQRGCEDGVETFFYSPITDDEVDSEEEYEFGVTPPAGVIKPERMKKSHVKHCETQYNENDWAMPSMFPHPPNPFVQYGACVLGERKKPFDWIYGKGNVHEEPKPPLKRNKPKMKKKKKELPGRQAGGFDNPNIFQAPSLTSKKNWHKSNSSEMSSFTDVPIQMNWH